MPHINIKAIDMTILVATNGKSDYETWEIVQQHITEIEETRSDGVRAIIFEGKVRRPTAKERECINEDEEFTTKPFDE